MSGPREGESPVRGRGWKAVGGGMLHDDVIIMPVVAIHGRLFSPRVQVIGLT